MRMLVYRMEWKLEWRLQIKIGRNSSFKSFIFHLGAPCKAFFGRSVCETPMSMFRRSTRSLYMKRIHPRDPMRPMRGNPSVIQLRRCFHVRRRAHRPNTWERCLIAHAL